MDTLSIKEFEANHVAAWNERDRAKRDALLGKIYAADIKMYDAQLVVTGIKEVSDLIGKLQAGDPAFHFSTKKPIEPLQNSARLFGEIATGQGPLASMDFFIFEHGKVTHLYAFIGPAS
jgi:hypothetical protein